MDKRDYRSTAAGRLIRVPEGYVAFVPAPLPPHINYTDELVAQLSRADVALSELSALGNHLPNPHLLIGPYIRREAALSSRIEGTRTQLADLLRNDVEPLRGDAAGSTDMREVNNYVDALEHGIRRLPELPLSLRLVRELHERLMAGVRGEIATPGRFRRTQNWIGRPGSTLETATYVPPPPSQMLEALSDWEKFLHRRDLPDLVQCALMHQQFEALHPFLDGNGRVGRLLITLFLVERGRLSKPLLYLSEYFEAHRSEYYDLLQRVCTDGDWESWLAYFPRGTEETANHAVEQGTRLLTLRETWLDRFAGQAPCQAVIELLFENPYVTVAQATEALQYSNPTVRRAVGLLQAEGILSETTSRSWGKVYVARTVLKALV